jgi:hypothetical protein
MIIPRKRNGSCLSSPIRYIKLSEYASANDAKTENIEE